MTTLAAEPATTLPATDAVFYPATVTPPPAPLPVWQFYPQFVRNPLLTLPRAIYDEPMLIVQRRNRAVCYVSDPDLVRVVLLERQPSFPKTPIEKRVLGAILGDGILTTEAADWRWQRQTLAPLFRPADMLAFVPDMVTAADAAVARWREAAPGSTHDIDRDMTRTTYDVIATTLVPGGTEEVRASIEQSGDDMLQNISWPLALAMLNAPDWVPYPGKRRYQRANALMRRLVTELVAERRGAASGHHDILARLVRARHPETGEAMSDTQIVDNVLTFLAAGHETTAKALTWTLYLLSRASEWQARLVAETARVVGDGPVQAEHIDKLALHTQVVKESMRLYPPAPVISRIAAEDVQLGGQTIKRGTLIVLSMFAMHRHTARWADPNRFDPGRFEPAREAAMPRYQYMPFGAGPRICIGSAFAMIEAVALLASLVRGARFEPVPGHKPVPLSRVTLRPAGGMPLGVWVR